MFAPIEQPNVRQPRWVLWLTVVSIALFVIWASQAEIDQITRGQGEVIPTSRVQVVQSEEGGVIESLSVIEGDRVEPGARLLAFENTFAQADYLDAKAKSVSLNAALTRLRAEVLEETFSAPAIESEYAAFYATQKKLLERRRKAFSEEIASVDDILRFVEEEIAINAPLVAQGDVSQTEVLRLQRQAAELKANKINVKNRFFQEAQTELAQKEEEYERVQQMLVQRERALKQTTIVSPVKGLITNIQFSTLGAVVRPGEAIMEVVPVGDELLIEAKIATNEIGFVRIGQSVAVKIDAFDYTVFGDLAGELMYISADAQQEDTPQGEATFYKVRVITKGAFRHQKTEDLTILPGMTASVEIKTGTNTILNYLLKPITKTLAESFGER